MVWKINLYGLDLFVHSFSYAFSFNYVTYLVMLQTWNCNKYFQPTGPRKIRNLFLNIKELI